MHVVVIGGGLMGTTSAWYLRQAGHDVTLVERHAGLADETSFANAGLITPSQAEPWNPPGTIGRLLRYLGREDSPLLLRPSALPGMTAWGLRFLWQSRAASFHRNAAANTRLAAYSLTKLRELRAELGLVYDHESRGTLKLLASQQALDHAAAHLAALKNFGIPGTVLDRPALLALEPALTGSARGFAGAIHFPDDETGDARRFTLALGEHLSRHGVALRFGVTALGFSTKGDRLTGLQTDQGPIPGDAFLLAGGTASPALVRSLDVRLPIYPVKGYSATVPIAGWNGAPRIAVIDEGLMLAVTPLGARLRIGGTAEFAGFDRVLNPARARVVLNGALKLYPALAVYAEESRVGLWTGLRPMTPDGRPIIGRTRPSNLFINAGHGGLGWTMACGAGKLAADLISGAPPDLPAADFAFR
jgi:D-amino-acid dehydrogenase